MGLGVINISVKATAKGGHVRCLNGGLIAQLSGDRLQ